MSESACVLNEQVSIFVLQVGWVFTPCHLHLRILGGKCAWSSQFTFSSSSKVFLKKEGNRKQRENVWTGLGGSPTLPSVPHQIFTYVSVCSIHT